MFQAPRGTQDILPEQASKWRALEAAARHRAELHGFGEIRTPTFEDIGLFVRGVGQGTDIVEKELYAFEDKGGDCLALRPEGTASVVRAYLERGLFNRPQPVKLYSIINVFRHDRPQAGRYREFHQLNCEAIGENDPIVDAELISLLWRWLKDDLGLRGLSLQLNSIGDAVCRPGFVETLVEYYRGHLDQICDDDRRRLETNPLRLLDCKRERCQPIIEGAPKTVDHLCGPCAEHFAALREYLAAEGLGYELNSRLVRGLDYYTRTVFEVYPSELGAQSALGGGGRYDGLAEQIGGRPTPGVGFAAGLERILLNLEKQELARKAPAPDLAFLVPLGRDAKRELSGLGDRLRRAGVAATVGTGDRSVKALLRQANAVGARWALIMGDQELSERSVNLRDLRVGEQRTVRLEAVVEELVGLVAR
jgi:histidyl-tRNA synthetase